MIRLPANPYAGQEICDRRHVGVVLRDPGDHAGPNLSAQMFGGAQQNVLAKSTSILSPTTRPCVKAQANGPGPRLGPQPDPLRLAFRLELTIRQQALIEEARQQHFAVSDEELRDVLRHDPRFAPALYPGDKFIGQAEI